MDPEVELPPIFIVFVEPEVVAPVNKLAFCVAVKEEPTLKVAVFTPRLRVLVAPTSKLKVGAVVLNDPLLAKTSPAKVETPVTPRVLASVVAPVTFSVLFKIVFKYELKVPAPAAEPRFTLVVDPETPAVPKFIVFVAPETVAPVE